MRWFVALAVVLSPQLARADASCRIADVQFTPSEKLQIVGWIEDAAGHYVDTIFITQQVGTYGLGNRPGRFDFNSAPNWPFGRRTTVFPVWSHKHGKTFPELVFRDGADSDLSHPLAHSSPENHYCRPLDRGNPGDRAAWDAGTCATRNVGTDKGRFADGTGSCSKTHDGGACTAHLDCCSDHCDQGKCTSVVRYPPRVDVIRQTCGMSPPCDDASVDMFAALDPWDAVSQATPAGGAPVDITWAAPPALPSGDYVVWLEVAKEFDPNNSYNVGNYPPPSNIAFSSYGQAYRGQPAILYKVPFTIGGADATATTTAYAGYADPDGIDGNVRAPDTTITTDTPASGAARLQLVTVAGAMARVRVDSRTMTIAQPPAPPTDAQATAVDMASATVAFTASAQARGYEVRVRANSTISDDNFAASMPVQATITGAGAQLVVQIDGLLPETDYSIGIRAYGICHDPSTLAIVAVRTTAPKVGEVSACFIATAAYGSAMANDVELLRRFRDSRLSKTVLGELAIESYYTFGPAVAGVVGESELLRGAARAMLAPIVRTLRTLRF